MKRTITLLALTFLGWHLQGQETKSDKYLVIDPTTLQVDGEFPFDRYFWIKMEFDEKPEIHDIRLFKLNKHGEKVYPRRLGHFVAATLSREGNSKSDIQQSLSIKNEIAKDILIKSGILPFLKLESSDLDFGIQINKSKYLVTESKTNNGKYDLLIKMYPLNSRQVYGLKFEIKPSASEVHDILKEVLLVTSKDSKTTDNYSQVRPASLIEFTSPKYLPEGVEIDTKTSHYKCTDLAIKEVKSSDYAAWKEAYFETIRKTSHTFEFDDQFCFSVEAILKSMADSNWVKLKEDGWKKAAQWLVLLKDENYSELLLNGLISLQDFTASTNIKDLEKRRLNYNANQALIDDLLLQFEGKNNRVQTNAGLIEPILSFRKVHLLCKEEFEANLKKLRAEEAKAFERLNQEAAANDKTYNQVIETSSTSDILSFEQRGKLQISPDFGFMFYSNKVKGFDLPFAARPYLGFHVNFKYLEKDIPFRLIPNKTLGHYLSLHMATTIGSVAIPDQRYDLFESINSSMLVGLGVRLSNSVRLSGGALIFQMEDPNPTVTTKSLGVSPILALSIDLDLRNRFNGFTNLFPSK